MKTVVIVFLATACLASFSSSVADEPGLPAATPNPWHEEMTRLRREYDHRRADALRPLAGAYLAQLQALQKRVLEQNRAGEVELAEAVKTARETYWQEDQPELRQALLARSWVWRSDVDDQGVAVNFHDGGTVEHIGLHGTWRITGPNEVSIVSDGDGPYVLRFNASLRSFEGDRRGINGAATPTPVETLCGHIWSLRDDKLEFRRNGRLVQLGSGWEGKDWHLSGDGKEVTITFTNGNGGTFRFERGTMTHFDGTPFRSTPRH